jgi:hypothetical protein
MSRKGRLQRRKRQSIGSEGVEPGAEENSDSSEMSGTDEEDDKRGKLDRIEEEDEVASNTAEAEAVVNLTEVAEVESNLPSAEAEAEDNTIKVEETRQDPVDEAVFSVLLFYLLDLFADENAKYLDTIINRRKGQNVR